MNPAPTTQTDTKDRILDAAENLFADKGFDATSLRMITSAAGVNLASVNYHFQSKEALLHAVYARRAGPVNAKRLELLTAYEASKTTLEVEPILEALMRPMFEIGESRECVPRLMMRLLYLDANSTSRAVFQAQFHDVFQRFRSAFLRALPHVPEQELILRIQFVIGALANTIAGSQNLKMLTHGRMEPSRSLATLRRLISFCAAGLKAPASSEEPPCHS